MLFVVAVSQFPLCMQANAWTIRTEYPSSSSSAWMYYSAPINNYPLSPYNKGNCTWYAYGRAYEVYGKDPGLGSAGDAGNWYNYAKNRGMSVGSTPKAGSIICWSTHVAFVESVSGGTVTWTESNYQYNNSQSMKNFKKYSSSNPSTYCSGYGGVLLGYIYLDGSGSVSPSVTYENIATGKYFIKNKGNGAYLNVAYGTDEDKTTIHSYEFGNYDSQVYSITSTGNGYEMMPLCSTTRVVNPFADNVVSGKTVNLYHKTNESSQWWKFQPVSGGYVIRNVQNPNVCITDGNTLHVDEYSGSDNQIWVLEKACTISYHANGGTGAPAASRVRGGYSTTVSSAKPSRTGYRFLGWSLQSGGTTASYQPNQTITLQNDTTLYAVWSAYGDVDGNKSVNAEDALVVLKTVVGKTTLTYQQKTYADVNGDGTVNAQDALLILQKIVGKIKTFPIEK